MRAWRQIDHFEPRAPFRAWLYRIATNVCLTMIMRRNRRSIAIAPVSENELSESEQYQGEPVHLDPYPDNLLDELLPGLPGPEAMIEQQESVELAFVSAVQLLPPRQRAALLLRDVIGYSVAEVATILSTSVAGINSALQRARSTLEQERTASRVARTHSRTNSDTEQALVRRLVEAWHSADIPSIVGILTEDAVFTMPPLSVRYVGPDEIGGFLGTGPGGGRLDRFRLVPIRANRQPAFAVYYRDGGDGAYEEHAVLVIAIEGDAIASLTRFTGPDLFKRFGLPPTFEG